jgi:hypothetical protein
MAFAVCQDYANNTWREILMLYMLPVSFVLMLLSFKGLIWCIRRDIELRSQSMREPELNAQNSEVDEQSETKVNLKKKGFTK